MQPKPAVHTRTDWTENALVNNYIVCSNLTQVY